MAERVKKLAVIGFGSTMIGIGVNSFIVPFHLINGGMFGISLVLNYLWGLKIGLLLILLNLPVYLLAFKSDPSYFYYGVIGAITSGFMIEILKPLNGIFHLPIISSVILGGIIIGLGIGVMLRNQISPGGMDLLALLLAKWSKINVGVIAFAMDTLLILSALVLLQEARLLYSLLIIAIVGLLVTFITSFTIVENECL